MTLEQYAYLAEIIGVILVIASLIFVGVEIRRNTNQAKLQAWTSLIDRFISVFSEADDLDLANVIAKGRKDFNALTDGERVAYDNFMYQVVVSLEALLIFATEEVLGRQEMERQFDNHIRYHIGCPGGLAWYREYRATRPFPVALSERIERLLEITD